MDVKKSLWIITLLLLAVSVAAYTSPTVSKTGSIDILNKDKYTDHDTRDFFVNQDPDPASPGGFVELRFKIENTGLQPVHEVKVELLTDHPFTLAPGQEALRELGTLRAVQIGQEAAVVTYKLRVASDAVEGQNEVTLRYTSQGRSWVSKTYQVNVRTFDAILSLKEVTTEPEQALPGDSVDLDVTLESLADSDLKNIQLQLDLGTSFTPLKGTNIRHVRSLASKQESDLHFTLAVDSEASSQVHQIPYKLSYQDHLGKDYTQNGTLGISIYETPDFTLSIESTEVNQPETKGTVILSLANVGSSEMRFVTLTLKESPDYEILSAPNVYIGNLESDDFETAEFTILANNVDAALQVELGYKDEFNDAKAAQRSLPLRLYERSEAIKYGLAQGTGAASIIISFILLITTSVFWLFTLIDCAKTRRKRYQKLLWLVLIASTHVVGALIYYFIGRKRTLAGS